MSDTSARLRRLELSARWLQLASGLAVLGLSSLIAFRVLSATKPAPAPPAVYAPVVVALPAVVRAKPGHVQETERPASGFIVVVESHPEPSDLWIDGVLDGPTPASHNFECKPGQQYSLELKHAGYLNLEHTVSCKTDVMVVIEASLEPMRKR